MDFYFFQQINNLAGRWECLDGLAVFLAEYLAYILIAFLFFVFWRKKKAILQALSAGIFARFFIIELIRLFWQRPRPFVENEVNLLLEHQEASFPSGHASFFFALSFVAYKYNKKTGILFFVASFLISISRVFAGIHWPTDIMAGALIGVFSGWLALKIFKRF